MNKMKISHQLAVALVFWGTSAVAQDTPSPTPGSSPAASATPAVTPLPTPAVSPSPASTLPTPPAVSGEESQMAVPPPDEQLLAGPTPSPGIASDVNWSEQTYTAQKGTSFADQPASPANGVTLDQAVATAIQRNASILDQLATIKQTRGQVVEIRAQALPQLNALATYDQVDPDETNTNNGNGVETVTAQIDGRPVQLSLPRSSGQTSGTNDKSWRLAFEVTQLLYSGGQVGAAIRAAKITEDSAFYQLRDTVDTVISDVRKQFYLVLLNRALIKVQEESVALLESQLKDQQNRFDAGTVPRFNVLQASVALANARPPLIEARNNYQTAQLQLARLVGVSWPTNADLSPFPVKGKLEFEPRNVNLAAAIQTALERRAFLKVQRATILADLENIKVQLAGYKPTINANAGWEFRNEPAADDLSDTVEGWFFGFTGNWAIFDGLATHGRVLQARARLEAAKVNYEDSVRQVEQEVQNAYLSILQARETINSQQKAVAEAEESLRLARERLNAGAGTQLDVLNAQVALTQAQSTGLQALSDYDTALAEFDRVTGASTIYHETFDDPLTNPETRKRWFSKKRKTKPQMTEAQIQENLRKRMAADAGQGD
ncbi:MAG TPA: TolC family protein [Chthoniobacterales bacterium]